MFFDDPFSRSQKPRRHSIPRHQAVQRPEICICAGAHGCCDTEEDRVQILRLAYENIWNYMKIYENIWNYMKVYGNHWKYMERITFCDGLTPRIGQGLWNSMNPQDMKWIKETHRGLLMAWQPLKDKFLHEKTEPRPQQCNNSNRSNKQRQPQPASASSSSSSSSTLFLFISAIHHNINQTIPVPRNLQNPFFHHHHCFRWDP